MTIGFGKVIGTVGNVTIYDELDGFKRGDIVKAKGCPGKYRVGRVYVQHGHATADLMGHSAGANSARTRFVSELTRTKP